MPDAYLIAHIRAHDMEKMQEFGRLARPAIERFGGMMLVSDQAPEVKEGPDRGFAVVVRFESLEAANRFYHSDDYSAAKAIRLLAAETELVIALGV